jgi:hypothetical protein
VLVLGTDIKDLFQFPFHGLLGSTRYLVRDTYPKFNLVLNIMMLPRFVSVDTLDKVLVYPEESEIRLSLPNTLIGQEY